jgi:hypothetical protein
MEPLRHVIYQARPDAGRYPRVAVVPGVWALLCMIVGMLAACGPAQTSVVSATPTPTPRHTPVLAFQSDWSKGLDGWDATPGWSIVDGALQSDEGDQRSVTIPFQPTGSDYAVEAEIQVAHIPRDNGMYALVAPRTSDSNGYQASVTHLLLPGQHTFADHPNEAVYIDPLDGQDPTTYVVNDFEPRTTYRTYRVEVHGSWVLWMADGHKMSSANSLQPPRLSAGPLQLICSSVTIRVRAIRVISL